MSLFDLHPVLSWPLIAYALTVVAVIAIGAVYILLETLVSHFSAEGAPYLTDRPGEAGAVEAESPSLRPRLIRGGYEAGPKRVSDLNPPPPGPGVGVREPPECSVCGVRSWRYSDHFHVADWYAGEDE